MLSHHSHCGPLILLQPGFNPIVSLHLFSEPQCLPAASCTLPWGLMHLSVLLSSASTCLSLLLLSPVLHPHWNALCTQITLLFFSLLMFASLQSQLSFHDLLRPYPLKVFPGSPNQTECLSPQTAPCGDLFQSV